MKQSKLAGAVALVGAQAAVLLFGYATHLWIGRQLGPAAYGIYGVVLSVQSILAMFLTLGVPSAVSRFVAQDHAHANDILRQGLKIQTVVAIILASISLIASPVMAYFLGDSTLMGYIAFSALVVFLQAFYPIYSQYFSGLHFFNRQAVITVVYATAKLVGAIGLLYAYHVYGAFAGFAIGGVVAGLLGWWWTKNHSTTKHTLPLSAFLSFASTYVLILVGLQILMSLDLFMVKAILHSDVKAGYYNAAVTLSRIPYFLLQALTFILLPSISALTKPGASQQKAVDFIKQTLRYLIILIIPAITLAAATSKQLITLFYSTRYLEAAPVLTLLMIGLGSLAFYLMLVTIVAGAGRGKAALVITVAMLVISPVIGFVLIPTQLGLIGAALQTTIASIVGFIAIATYTFRTFGISLPWRSLINVGIATVVMILPTYFFTPPTLLLPIFYIVLGAVYVGALALVREFNAEDRMHIANSHPALSWLKPN